MFQAIRRLWPRSIAGLQRITAKPTKRSTAVAALVALVAGTGATTVTKSTSSTPVEFYRTTIYVRNQSTYVTNKEIANDLPAFQASVTKDFAPYWGIDAHFVFVGRKPAPSDGMLMTIEDKSDVKHALAYHEITKGRPDSRIFAGTSRYYGYNWTVGFMHEALEMLADADIVRTLQSFDGTIWAGEVCDPVERDAQGYTRPGKDGKLVQLSDFVTPRWFGADTNGPYDYMNLVRSSLQILPGGYAQFWDGISWHVVSNFRGYFRHAHYY
jgi:hypothetical protein